MAKQRYYTNGVPYSGSLIKDARETLGPDRYKEYDNFGPSLTDNHAGSFPAMESFQIGNFMYEVYEYECMSLGFRGYVSENHKQRAIRFYPLVTNCE
jgi:hypothetical protein